MDKFCYTSSTMTYNKSYIVVDDKILVICFMIKKRLSTANQFYKLTSREKEIYNKLVQKCTYKEISVTFGITLGTVKQHVHSIYSKLGVKSRDYLY